MIERTLQEHARTLARILPRRRALEVGALPSRYCILSTPAATSIPERVGLNLTEVGRAPNGVDVVEGDARSMPFPDDHFDLVVSNSTLEHIPDFWLAVAEMHRVLAPGGYLLVATPGYRRLRGEATLHRIASRLPAPDVLRRATLTMRVHNASEDYYRFSADTYHDVIMAGLEDVEVWHIMLPPRIFALGRKRPGGGPT